MQISKRLEAVAGMVTPGSVLADVGTDHAYIPIYLVRSGAILRAVALDVNKGPLEKAREHIAQYGLSDRIETRLSDGLAGLERGEAQSIVIAGMGGPLTVRILQDGSAKLPGCRELILQPQSDIRCVRAYLSKTGWRIVREEMVCEEGKYYPMMRAVREADCAPQLSPSELRFGPLLLQNRHPVLRDYLLREKRLNTRILASLDGQTGDGAAERRREVETELALIEQSLALYREQESEEDTYEGRRNYNEA